VVVGPDRDARRGGGGPLPAPGSPAAAGRSSSRRRHQGLPGIRSEGAATRGGRRSGVGEKRREARGEVEEEEERSQAKRQASVHPRLGQPVVFVPRPPAPPPFLTRAPAAETTRGGAKSRAHPGCAHSIWDWDGGSCGRNLIYAAPTNELLLN